MKRDKYDEAVSDLVRERAHWTCEKCGLVDTEGQAKGKSRKIQASHYYGRGKGNIARYDTVNVRALCDSCHHQLENAPYEHTSFIESLLSGTTFELLQTRCNQTYKMKKAEKEEMLVHYRFQFKELRESREEGLEGYKEVVNWF